MDTLYARIAQHITEQINNHTYRAGDRILSVRRLSTQLDVSISTALEAYRALENQGLIEARPQSGYYVRTQTTSLPPQPAMSNPSASPESVSVSQLTMRMLNAVNLPDIIQLGAAVPHSTFLPTPQLHRALINIIRHHGDQGAAYELPQGSHDLRVQIARRAVDSGCSLSPDDIIITTGCQEALHLSLRAVARAGDTIAIESPTYHGLLQAIESLGMKALEIPTHPQQGISLDALRLAIEQWPIKACALATNFSNPLGCSLPDQKKQQLVALLSAHNIPLIEDDIHGDLGFSSPRPKTAKAYDRTGHVLLCSSFSKTLAPGFRVGWIVPGYYKTDIIHLKSVTTMGTATLPQLAIATFLSKGGYDRYLRKARHEYATQIARVTHTISTSFPTGTKVTQPGGGFVLWLELPENVNALTLQQHALMQKISIAPGPMFSAKQKYQHCIRLNCATPWSDKMEQAIRTLGQLAAQQ